MKKFSIATVLVVLGVISSVYSAEASGLGAPFIKLVNTKALSSQVSLHYEDTSSTSLYGKKIPYVDITTTSRGDASTPGAVRLDNSFIANSNILTGSDVNVAINVRLIGSTAYVQIPNMQFDTLLPWLVPYKGQWIRIGKEDIDAIAKDIPEVTTSYNEVIKTNNQPLAQMARLNTLITKYDKAISLRKYDSRVASGTIQDRYIITINKNVLKNILIQEINRQTYDVSGNVTISKEYNAYRMKSITDFVNSLNFKSETIYIGRTDGLPYEFNGIIQVLNAKKKVQSTTKIKLSFSDFGAQFNDIVAPATYKTATEIYNISFKAMIQESHIKGMKAQLKSQLANFRAVAELTANAMGNTYGTNSGSCISPAVGSVFNPVPGKDTEDIKGLLKQIMSSSATTSCYANGTSYAIQASYKETTGAFCVDSTGTAKDTIGQLTGTTCGN